ncbi:MAG: MFS transporter, partial [Dehalococcoidia bacterium]
MPRIRVFYGWWIVAAGCAVWAVYGMTGAYGASLFYKRLLDDFGWGRAQLAGALSLSSLESGLLGGLGGFVVDRYGPRFTMLTGIIIMTAGLVLLSRIDSLLEFYLVYVLLVGVGSSLSLTVPMDTTVANWFVKRRGTAFGFLRGATALGAAGVPLLALFIGEFGWRAAYVVSGLGMLAVGIPTALIMRRRPEFYGQLPDGEVREDQGSPELGPIAVSTAFPDEAVAETVGPDAESELGMTAREALRSRAFWTIGLGFGLRMLVSGSVMLHAIPLIEDLGYSGALAASVLGSIGLVSLIGRLGGGWLCDCYGSKRVAVISTLTMAVASLTLAYAQTLWMVLLFVAIYGPSFGSSVAAMPTIRADYFGRR